MTKSLRATLATTGITKPVMTRSLVVHLPKKRTEPGCVDADGRVRRYLGAVKTEPADERMRGDLTGQF